MIKKSVLEEAMYSSMKAAATKLPPDVDKALRKAAGEETSPLALMHLEAFFENVEEAARGRGLVCGDTGFPMFFLRAGDGVRFEGGVSSIQKTAEKAVSRLTVEAFLRPTMVNPLSRSNPGDNIGPGMPRVEIIFIRGLKSVEITAAPKGGGSEIFGTFYRMLFPSDGAAGVKSFVIDCIKKSCYAGKICPPAIVGVGIGGTSDLCMSLAKKAALLRKVGSRNPDKKIASLEKELFQAARMLGIGPMGASGVNAVIGVHIETAYTHTAALPVAFNAQCLVGRRWKAVIAEDNTIKYTGEIQ
jgi:L(+)-tartrate dehydratase alpha subunit